MTRCPTFLLLLLLTANAAAADLLISKDKRSLMYTEKGVSREFKISLGSAPVGAKLKQGDRKTPEGVYFIMNKNAKSNFYLSLGVSYPNIDDAKAGLSAGLITKSVYAKIERANRQRRIPPQGTALGGDIYIHGGGTESDWTWGCIALNNADMDFLFKHVKVGDKVTILK